MAKIYGLSGYVRGRRGNDVFRSVAGVGTVVSQYQPAVRNPRTLAQTRQRSKMNLAGLISKMTPAAAIAGLAPSRREARSKFVSSILKNAFDTSAALGQFNGASALLPERLVLSEGVDFTGIFTANGTSGNYILEVQGPSPSEDSGYLGFMVVAYINDNETYYACVTALSPANESIVNIDLAGYGNPETRMQAEVFVVPFVSQDADARAAFQNLIAVGSNDAMNAGYIRTLATKSAYGNSRYLGKVTILQQE